MITYELFDEIITAIKEQYKKQDTLVEVLNIEGIINDGFPSKVIKLLTAIFKDTSQWIEYWVYELDFGKKYKSGTVTEKINNKIVNIPLKTTKDLYYVLIDNINKEKE